VIVDYVFVRNLAMIGIPTCTIGGAAVAGAVLRRGGIRGPWVRGGLLTLASWLVAVPLGMLTFFVWLPIVYCIGSILAGRNADVPDSIERQLMDGVSFAGGLGLWVLLLAIGCGPWWRHGRRGARMAAVSAVALATASGPIFAIGCWFTDARAKAQSGSCQCNLQQLGLAIQYNASEHGGRFPAAEGWREALRSFAPEDILYECPSKPGVRYRYQPPSPRRPPTEARMIVCCHSYLHRSNVLFGDGTVRSR